MTLIHTKKFAFAEAVLEEDPLWIMKTGKEESQQFWETTFNIELVGVLTFDDAPKIGVVVNKLE